MLVDLHAHFPMHLSAPEQRGTHDHVLAFARRRWQARIVGLISRLANYQGPHPGRVPPGKTTAGLAMPSRAERGSVCAGAREGLECF